MLICAAGGFVILFRKMIQILSSSWTIWGEGVLQSCKIKTFYSGSDYLALLEVLKQNSFTQNKLSLLIRIDDFPSFVASKARCFTREFNVNNTWWYVGICLDKWCETRERYTALTPESFDQPEFLSAGIWGNCAENICNDRSFDVAAIFKFKHSSADEQIMLPVTRFHFKQSNGNKDNSDFPILAGIGVTFYRIVYFIPYRIFYLLRSFHLGYFEPTKWLFG